MAKLSVPSWIGNAAAALCGHWGSVSERAEQAGCSRQTVYEHAARVRHAVEDHLAAGPSRQQLLEQVAQLQRENAQLWEAWRQSIEGTETQQQKFLVTASAMGLSLTQILCLLAIFVPAGRCPSRATLGRWLATWCERAGQVLRRLDQACRATILTLCIDEIFFRRQPVLVGVEPHSMAWVIGQRAENRNGQTWCTKAEAAFHQAEGVEAAWRQAEQALELFRPDGQLNDRAWATARITAAIRELGGPSWAKVCRMLSDPHALAFLDRMHRQLREAEPNEELRTALTRLWWLRRQRHAASRANRESAADHALPALQQIICQRIDPQWQAAYHALGRVLLRTVRASSVVECMNSVIRMHQARHRTLTQPLMDLKRLYWNCRAFREGKRAQHTPYELLGLQLPTCEFWELLNLHPDELTQKVSTTKTAA